MGNYYKLLRVKPNASPDVIKKKFKKSVDKYADSSLSESGFQELELLYKAYHTLIEPGSRAAYDKENSIGKSGDEASWRKHYKDYKSKDVKADLAVAEDAFDNLNISKKQPVSWNSLIVFVLFLACLAGGFAYLLLTGA